MKCPLVGFFGLCSQSKSPGTGCSPGGFQTQKHNCSLWKLLFFIQQYETRHQSESYYCGWQMRFYRFFFRCVKNLQLFKSALLHSFRGCLLQHCSTELIQKKWHLRSYPAPEGGEVLMNKLHIPQQWFPDIRLLLHANPLSDEMWGFIFTPSHTNLRQSSTLRNTSVSM